MKGLRPGGLTLLLTTTWDLPLNVGKGVITEFIVAPGEVIRGLDGRWLTNQTGKPLWYITGDIWQSNTSGDIWYGFALVDELSLFYPSMEKRLMEKLEFTIAGGWWWCERCRKNHVECSPCPRDPNVQSPDPEKVKAHLDEAVNCIRANENATRDLKAYIPKIEEGAYTCLCVHCGKQFYSNDKRSILCGC